MKKRLSLLLICVFAICITLSGCNLFVTNAKAYYDQPVANLVYTVNNEQKTITITKEELTQSYSRYYQTLSQYNYTGEGMIEYLINYLTEQKIVLNEVDRLIEEEEIVVDDAVLTEIYESTLSSMESMLNDYRNEVVADWKIDVATSPQKDSEEEVVKYTEYKPTAKVIKVGDEYKIVLADTDDKDKKVIEGITAQNIVSKVTEKLNAKISNDKFLKEAQKRYIASLKNYQEDRQGKTFTNDELWQNEIERVYKDVTNNRYINLYIEYLEDMSVVGGVTYAGITINDVLKYLENQIKMDYLTYSINPSAYSTDILSSRDGVYYCLNDAEQGDYFYVSHILIKFGEDMFKDLDVAYAAGGMSSEDYKSERTDRINKMAVKLMGDKIEGVGDIETMSDLVRELNKAISKCLTNEDKFAMFNKFVYAYSQDDGNKNKDYDYVVGTKNSQMVEPFTDASRKLYEDKNIGGVSEMVESEYGIHLIMYVGNVENWFNITNGVKNFSLTDNPYNLGEIVHKITTTKLSVMNNKTIFDLVYDTLATDNLSILQKLNVETLKSQYTITKYPASFKDMY